MKSKRGILFLVLLTVPLICLATTISYFNDGFLRQGNAYLDRVYLGIEGSNIFNWGTNAPWNTSTQYVQRAGDTMSGPLTNLTHITATNLVLSAVKWVDIPMNYSATSLGANTPTLTQVTNDSVIYGLGFDVTDIMYAQAQFSHNVATTNAAFPSFYFEPHVHFTCIAAGKPTATESNVTWRAEWQLANINGTWYSGTNQLTMGITNNHVQYLAALGHITNNVLPHISAIFRCRLTRPASAAQEYDSLPNSHTVILDAFDIHIPVGNQNAIGTSGLAP